MAKMLKRGMGLSVFPKHYLREGDPKMFFVFRGIFAYGNVCRPEKGYSGECN